MIMIADHSMLHAGILKIRSSRLTLMKCYYSETWSWVKPLTIPESPSIALYNTCLGEGLCVLYQGRQLG